MLWAMSRILSNNAQPMVAASGWLIMLAILLSAANGFGVGLPAAAAGATFWLAAILLAPRVVGLQRIQTLVMLAIGGAGLMYAWFSGGQPQWYKVLVANQALLAMLAGVSFLRLVSLPQSDADERDPRGPAALLRTLLGVHLFGSVINLSAVMILGDRQARSRALAPLQATVLSRGFSLAAHWSPFFAAMGVALSNSPGSQLLVLSSVGLPVAALGLALTASQLSRRPGVQTYIGYPMHFAALWIPGLLALLVLLCHLAAPSIPILTLISSLAVLLTLGVLLARTRERSADLFFGHVREGLPRMSGELLLFLAAGVLAAGIGSLVQSTGWGLQLSVFGATETSLMLLLMVGLSVAGVHPVISIATAHGLLTPLAPDPNLIGIAYLMAWAQGVAISPLSGMHLGMQGRFGIDPRGFLRWNGSYTLAMLALDVGVLHLYEVLMAH